MFHHNPLGRPFKSLLEFCCASTANRFDFVVSGEGDVVVECTVYPCTDIRRAPKSSISGRTMQAAAIAAAAHAGKGIYAMQALAGGNLITSARESLAYVRDLAGVHAVALGMLSTREIDANLAFFEGRTVAEENWQSLEGRRRQLRIMRQFCTGCSACVTTCSEGGLRVIDGKALIDADACVLCGYCAAACPEFIIRVV